MWNNTKLIAVVAGEVDADVNLIVILLSVTVAVILLPFVSISSTTLRNYISSVCHCWSVLVELCRLYLPYQMQLLMMLFRLKTAAINFKRRSPTGWLVSYQRLLMFTLTSPAVSGPIAFQITWYFSFFF